MFNVFLDTQVYDANNFQFNNKQFSRLKKVIDDGMINLLTTPITKREVQAHISEKVESAKQQFKKARILKNSTQYDPLLKDDSFKLAKEEILANFENFISDFKVVELPIFEGATKVIFENYFDKKPPFSEKKRDEFPDAFSLYTLLNWTEENEQIVYVVSRDPDIEEFCNNRQSLHHIESLEATLDYINQQDVVKYQLAQKLCAERIDELLMSVNTNISKKDFEYKIAVQEVYDIEDVEIKKFAIKGVEDSPYEFLFLDLQENKLTVVINIEFNFTILFNEIDPSKSPFDYEAGMYLHIEYEEIETTEVISIPVEFELNIKDYEKQEFTIESVKINEQILV
ncbi:PIN domain-containing protein [Bacillus altitudinis]|uniref:PIN domain-containing protein n=1 Tax=Bacillus altitudinis TaxID=293387 RepID=UPI0039826054